MTMSKHNIVMVAVIAGLLMASVIGAAFAYQTTTENTDNNTPVTYALLHVSTDSGTEKAAAYLLDNLGNIHSGTGSLAAHATEDLSPSDAVIIYEDTKDLTSDVSAAGEDYKVDKIMLIHLTISGLEGLEGSKITMTIGGAVAESIVLADGTVSMYTSVATVNFEEDPFLSAFKGSIMISVTNPTSSAMTHTGTSVDISIMASHTDSVADPTLTAGDMDLTLSDGHYSGSATLTYDEVRSTGAYGALITITLNSDDTTWIPTAGDVIVITLSGGSDYVTGYKFTGTDKSALTIYLPIPIIGGNYSGTMDVDVFSANTTGDIKLVYSLKEVGLSPASS